MNRLTKNNMENHRLLASAALFRGMYNEQLDQHDVLAKFIKATVTLNALHQFDVTQCAALLKSDFGFEIPDAVIRSCIRTKLKQEFKQIPKISRWQLADGFIPDPSIQLGFSESQRTQESLMRKLIAYVELKCKCSLSVDEESELIDDFHAHLKGFPRNNHNFPYIGNFILSAETDSSTRQILEQTQQGLIIFEGLRYSVESPGGKLPRDLAIYLDTEVLFSAVGLDGSLRQQLYTDFNSLVNELSSKAKAKIGKVSLLYFKDTEAEINNYFSAAESIANKRTGLTTNKPAMINILNGCSNGADVLSKKVAFFAQLKNLKINVDVDRNYFDPPTFNIESKTTIAELVEELSCEEDKASNALKQFSRINFLRCGANKTSLESVGYIFLSEKSIIRVAAFSEIIGNVTGGGIPFATDLAYMTEWLWFKLNKGFSTAIQIPVAFDVIARTRVVLSAQLSNKITHEYHHLVEAHSNKDSTITDEQLTQLIVELRTKGRQPEDVNVDSFDLNFLTSDDFVSNALAEHSALKIEVIEGRKAQQDLGRLKEQSVLEQTLFQSTIFTLQSNQAKAEKVQGWKDLRYKRREKNRPYFNRAGNVAFVVINLYWFFLIIFCFLIILFLKSTADSNLAVFGTVFTVIPVVIAFGSWVFRRKFKKFIARQKRCYLKKRLMGIKKQTLGGSHLDSRAESVLFP